MSEPSKIAVLEPDALSRSVVARILRDAGYSPVLFESEISFFHTPGFDQVECLIVNESLPVLSTQDIQLVLSSIAQHLPLIVVSDSPTIEGTVRAMRAGAVDVLPKPIAPRMLLGAIGDALILRARDRQNRAQRDVLMMRMARLSAREREVCEHVVAGRLNKQTAALLFITEKTVKVHRARIMEKLEVCSLPALVQLADAARQASCEARPTTRIATWSWDMRHDDVTGNSDLGDLFHLGGNAASGVPLRACLECVHPADMRRLRLSIDEAIVSRRPYQIRYRVVGDPGEESLVVAYGRVGYDPAGVPVRFAGVAIGLPPAAETQLAFGPISSYASF